VTPHQTRITVQTAQRPASQPPVTPPPAAPVRTAVHDVTYRPLRNIGSMRPVEQGKTNLSPAPEVQKKLIAETAPVSSPAPRTAPAERPAPAPAPAQAPSPAAEEPAPAVQAPAPAVHEEPAFFPDVPAWRVAGEVLNTYIIVEQGETVFFIDKHAAHERMNFDRMKAEGYDPMAQTLLAPVLCRLAEEEKSVLLSSLPLLEEFGFDVDELGRDLAVRQAPFDVDAGDIPATLEEIARKLLTTGTADPAAARDELLHTMACKAAIKGGWKTGAAELERVAKAVMDGSVKYCPHGRPVAIQLTKRELEKQFKRA